MLTTPEPSTVQTRCTHPAIAADAQAPLMLQTVLGLDAARIAASFLVAPASMGQRLVRAKRRIRGAGIAFAIPEAEDFPERLSAVLSAIYAAYGTAWDDVAGQGCRDPEHPADRCTGMHGKGCLFDRIQQPPRVGVIAAPFVGQGQRPGGALHQAHAEMILERCNLAADRRLTLLLFQRYSREAAGFDGADEGTDMFQKPRVHSCASRINDMQKRMIIEFVRRV